MGKNDEINYELIIKKINAEYNKYRGQSNSSNNAKSFFVDSTNKLREEVNRYINEQNYSEEEALEMILPKAYGLVKLATELALNKSYYDVQLMAGIVLNKSCVAEMATGEGKTITAALPVYLNALLGHGAHVTTPNAYLAKRDFEEMKQVYELLGLTCGLIEDINPVENQKEIQKVYTQKTSGLSGLSSEQIRELTEEAQKEVRIVDIRKRQKAYKCDVVYGSSSAFAFDRLFDELEPNPDLMRGRAEKPNFVLIDEADIVLIDDAVTPFVLSGVQQDESIAITEEEKERSRKSIELAARTLEIIEYEDKRLRELFRHFSAYKDNNLSTDGLVLEFDNIDDFNKMKASKDERLKKYSSTQALYICKKEKAKEFYITPVGYACAFLAFKEQMVSQIINNHKDDIINMRYDGTLLFENIWDYNIDQTSGEIVIAPRALSYIIEENIIPELTKEYLRFMHDDYPLYDADVMNAVYAWELLDRDVDYMFVTPSDAVDVDYERSISLILNGRAALGRLYSSGLQQAVEAKERIIEEINRTGIKIRESDISDTLISIPTASFFGRYKKSSGMTGTSAKEAFEELYGIETVSIPRNKPSHVKDRGDYLFGTRDDKYEAILKEVLVSHEKGQPVLITTPSVEESTLLFDYLDKELKRKGIDIKIPVLNAKVDKLSEEAKIIAKAGEKGAITIATEMAGRGTDIRLGGGEEVSIEKERERARDEYIIQFWDTCLKNAPMKPEEMEIYKAIFEQQLLRNKAADIEKKARRSYELKMYEKQCKESDVIAAGGLKIIGSGHFIYKRTDDQVKGRCGRQGDVGEVVFFSDLDDLDRIGVPHSVIDKLETIIGDKKYIFEEPFDGKKKHPLRRAIEEAQKTNEREVKDRIFYDQMVENVVADCRSRLSDDIEGIKRDNDYKKHLNYMVEALIYEMVIESSDLTYTDMEKVNDSNDGYIIDKRSTGRINAFQFRLLVGEFLGEDITPEEIEKCHTVRNLVDYLTNKTKGKIDAAFNGGEGPIKEMVDQKMGRTWYAFEERLDRIKNQQTDAMMVSANPLENLEPSILDAYHYCFTSMIAQIVRQVVNPKYLEKYPEDHFGLSEFIVNTNATTQRVSHQSAAMIKDEISVTEDFDQAPIITGLRVLPPFKKIFYERLRITKEQATAMQRDSGKKK